MKNHFEEKKNCWTNNSPNASYVEHHIDTCMLRQPCHHLIVEISINLLFSFVNYKRKTKLQHKRD